MNALDHLDRMIKAGVPYDTALEIARGFQEDLTETVMRVAADIASRIGSKKGTGAERTRKWRENKAAKESVTVTSRDVTTVTEPPSPPPSSPTPPSSTTSTSEPTPFTPLKGGVSPSLAEPDGPDLKAVAEEIWMMQPVVGGKRRSTRPDVLKALRAAVDRRGQEPARITAACQAYYRLPDCRKDGGQFASGAAVILAEDRWRDFEPTARERPPPKAEPAVYAAHVRHYRDTGEWNPTWGPKPDLEQVA